MTINKYKVFKIYPMLIYKKIRLSQFLEQMTKYIKIN